MTLSPWYSKSTWQILMKLTHVIKGGMQSLHTNFQANLYFHKKLRNMKFKCHKCLLWSCKHANKLKLL